MTGSEDTHQRPDPAGPDGAFDTIAALATALTCYLDEVHAAGDVCERHEKTAHVHRASRSLHLDRFFPWAQDVVEYLEQATTRLSGWERSLFWEMTRTACCALKRDAARGKGVGGPERPFLCRGVTWEGRPALVCAFGVQPEGRLHLKVVLPHIPAVPPELPLRTIASGLHCHAHLLPNRITQPLTRKVIMPRSGSHSPLTYLTRAMPPNLYASQWISQLGAAS